MMPRYEIIRAETRLSQVKSRVYIEPSPSPVNTDHTPLYPCLCFCVLLFLFLYINIYRIKEQPRSVHYLLHLTRHREVWYTLAGVREGQNVIHANPLKTKGLGRSPVTERPNYKTSEHGRETIGTIPESKRESIIFKPKDKPIIKRSDIVLAIVNQGKGFNSNQIEYLANEYCKRMNWLEFPLGSIGAILKQITDKGKVTRIPFTSNNNQINYIYYRRIEDGKDITT